MASTPKPLRKAIKGRVVDTKKLYKEKDALIGMSPQQRRALQKSDYKAVKKIVKEHGRVRGK